MRSPSWNRQLGRMGRFLLLVGTALAFCLSAPLAAIADEVVINATNVKIVRNGNVVSVTSQIQAVNPFASPLIDLELIEVQTGSYLGEDDIERIQDDYKRS